MVNPFLLDANILIQSHRRDYPFDIAPGFWEFLAKLGNEGLIAFPDVILKQMIENKDDLSKWMKDNESNFLIYLCSDEVVLSSYGIIINTVQSNNSYKQTAKAQFASDPDSWLIAVAMAYGLTIVTQEVYEPNCKKKVKIPNECRRHGINYIDRTEFMRAANFRWY
jgi:hypothetical protein